MSSNISGALEDSMFYFFSLMISCVCWGHLDAELRTMPLLTDRLSTRKVMSNQVLQLYIDSPWSIRLLPRMTVVKNSVALLCKTWGLSGWNWVLWSFLVTWWSLVLRQCLNQVHSFCLIKIKFEFCGCWHACYEIFNFSFMLYVSGGKKSCVFLGASKGHPSANIYWVSFVVLGDI